MNIWIVTLSEPLELDGKLDRPLRSEQMKNHLISLGHRVSFWSSTMNHVTKSQRAQRTVIDKLSDRLTYILLYGRTYKRNVSISRILHNWGVAARFRSVAAEQERPDAILCSFPPIELAKAVTRYGKENNVPVILDIRDFWPDAFWIVAPQLAKPFLWPAIWLWNRIFRAALEETTAVTGIARETLEWARAKQGKSPQPGDASFPHAYDNRSRKIDIDHEFLNELGLADERLSIFCLFGTLSERIEATTLIQAAEILKDRDSTRFRIVLCGRGGELARLQKATETNPVLLAPGWIDRAKINALLEVSRAGLLPYPSDPDFTRAYPNKIGEYLSASLPIISSVQGAPANLLRKYECGITYPNDDARALADAMELLSVDDATQTKMSLNAAQLFDLKFDAAQVYKSFGEYILSLAEGRSPVTPTEEKKGQEQE